MQVALAVWFAWVSTLHAGFTTIGRVSFGSTRAVLHYGNILIASSGNALEFYDVTYTAPSLIARVQSAGRGEVLVLRKSGDTLFVGTSGGSIATYDISDPARPRLLQYAELEDGVLDLRVKDTLLLLANGYFGLRILRRSDLSEVSHVGPSYATSLDYRGDTVFLMATSSPLTVIDVSDPSSPSVSSPTVSGCGGGLFLERIGTSHLLMRCGDTLKIYSISYPTSPSYVSTVTTLTTMPNRPYLSGDTLTIADFRNLKVYSLSDPTSPLLLADTTLDYMVGASAALHSGNLLYTFTIHPWRKMYVLDLTTWNLLHERQLPGNSVRVLKRGGYAFAYAQGLVILSVSDPSNPYVINFIPVDEGISTPLGYLDTVGSYLYVASGYHVLIYDVGDPISPSLRGSFSVPYEVRCFTAVDTTTFFLCSSSHLHLRSPLGDTSLMGTVYDVKVTPDRSMAVTVGTGGLGVVDITSRSVLGGVGLPFLSGPAALTLRGDTAYIVGEGNDSVNIWVVSLSDPTSPTLVSSTGLLPLSPFYMRVFPVGADKAGNYVFGSIGNVGVVIADVSDPLSPNLVDHLRADGQGVDVFVDGGNIYYLDNLSGLNIYRYPLPTQVEERETVVEVPFTLKGRTLYARKRMRIYSASGRLMGVGKTYTFGKAGVFFVRVGKRTYRVVIR